MFFKGLRVKLASAVVLKNIMPISAKMDREISTAPSSYFKHAHKGFVQSGANEVEAQIALLYVLATTLRQIEPAHFEFELIQRKLAQTICETGTNNLHVSINKVFSMLNWHMSNLVDGRAMHPMSHMEAMKILESSLDDAIKTMLVEEE